MKTTWYGGREVCATCKGGGTLLREQDGVTHRIDCPDCEFPAEIECKNCGGPVGPRDPYVRDYGKCGLCVDEDDRESEVIR